MRYKIGEVIKYKGITYRIVNIIQTHAGKLYIVDIPPYYFEAHEIEFGSSPI